MSHRSHPAHRRGSRLNCASCGHRLSGGARLVEHVAPGDSPVYVIEERETERSRILIIAANVGVHVLSLIGLFVLITTGQPDERVLIWQSTIFAGGVLSAGITTYYFTRRMEKEAPGRRTLDAVEIAPRPVAAGPVVPAVPRPVVTLTEPPRPPISVAVIGSFRKFYPEVCRVAGIFAGAGMTVAAPVISTIVNQGAEFVRFAVDPPAASDEELQALALERIFSADLVYVFAPDGYIGRTTCYELGQVLDRGIPIFYSHPIKDLPISIPAGAVCEATALASRFASGGQIALAG